jgi:DNA-directed RNA polymerase specialized sigma24 family protein
MQNLPEIQEKNRREFFALRSRTEQQLRELNHRAEIASAASSKAIVQAIQALNLNIIGGSRDYGSLISDESLIKDQPASLEEKIQTEVEWLWGIIEHHRSKLQQVVSKYFPRDKEMQEEIVQDSMASALEYVRNYGRESIQEVKILQWISAIARNKCFDIFKVRKKRHEISLNQTNAKGSEFVLGIMTTPDVDQRNFVLPERFDRKLLEKSFYEYLEGLDVETHYKILLRKAPRRGLRYFILLWGGLSHEQVSRALDVSVNSINCAVYRFRAWMEECAKEFMSKEELLGIGGSEGFHRTNLRHHLS